MKAYNWAVAIDTFWFRHGLRISLAVLTLGIGALIIFPNLQNSIYMALGILIYVALGICILVATIVAEYYTPAGDLDRDIPDKIDIPDNASVWYIEPDQHTEALKTMQTQSQKSQEFNETFFLPQVWLNMCTFFVQPEETLEKRYASLDWLREFTGSHPFDRSQADPSSPAHQSPNSLLGNFSQSFKKFSEAPDEFILCLQQYDTDVRDRDLAEYLTVYALRIGLTGSLWYLLEKIAQIERNSHTLEEADRATVSAEIQARMEDCDMEAKMRTFMQGRLKDHARDGDQGKWRVGLDLLILTC